MGNWGTESQRHNSSILRSLISSYIILLQPYKRCKNRGCHWQGISTDTRGRFSQLCSTLLKPWPWPPSLCRGTAPQEIILSGWNFQCSTFTLTAWMALLHQVIHFNISTKQLFLGANTSFPGVFFTLSQQSCSDDTQLMWDFAFTFCCSLQIKLDGGLLRCTFWVLPYHTGKCQPILQWTSQIQKWRLQYKLVFQWVGQ